MPYQTKTNPHRTNKTNTHYSLVLQQSQHTPPPLVQELLVLPGVLRSHHCIAQTQMSDGVNLVLNLKKINGNMTKGKVAHKTIWMTSKYAKSHKHKLSTHTQNMTDTDLSVHLQLLVRAVQMERQHQGIGHQIDARSVPLEELATLAQRVQTVKKHN